VAALAARREIASLELLYSGSTPLHAIIANARSFRRDAGFADRAGPPFSAKENAAVHATRALAGLGLALALDQPTEEPWRTALAWYTEARGWAAAEPWIPRHVVGKHPRLAELLANAGDECPAGALLTAAMTLQALASTEARRPRQAGVTVLLVRSGKGVRGDLKMSVARGLPAAFVPDPEQMSLFAGDPAFQQSLDRAWSQAGGPQVGGTVLWSIEEAEGPSRQINGESAGAAFAVTLGEIRRLSRPLARARVIRRLRSSNAVVGRIDDLGYLQGVEGYEGKLDALGEHSRVIVPVADADKASKADLKHAEIVAAAHWKEAASKARRPSAKVLFGQGLVGAVLAGVVAVGLVTGVFRHDLHDATLMNLSKALAAKSNATVAVNLRDADVYALAAWQAWETTEAHGSLLSREADPYLGSFAERANFVVTTLAISPDGRLLAVGGARSPQERPSSVTLWDIASRKLLAVFPVPGFVENVTFSADGTTLAEISTTTVRTLRIWSVSTHRPLPDPVNETGVVTSMAYSPDGQFLAVGMLIPPGGHRRISIATVPAVIDLWNPATHRLTRRISGLSGPIWSLDFSDDGRLLASGDDHAARLWDPDTGKQRAVLTDHGASVQSVQFEPGGSRILATAGPDRMIRVWNAVTGALYLKRPTGSSVPAFAFSPGEPYLYTASDFYDISRINLITGNVAGDPIRPQLPVVHMAFSPDGRVLVLGGLKGSLAALDIEGRTFYNPDGSSLTAAAVDRGGLLAATGTAAGHIQLWRVQDPAAVVTWSAGHNQDVMSAAFSPDGWRLAVGTSACRVLIWDFRHARRLADLNNARRVADLAAPGVSESSRFLHLAFSPDGKTLATYCSNNFQPTSPAVAMVWDARTFKLLAEFRPPGAVQAGDMAFSPDGRTLALDTGTGTVLLWDTRLRQVTGQLSVGGGIHDALAFSPDGSLLAISDDEPDDVAVRLWNVSTRSQITATSGGTSAFHSLAFSPDGSTLAGTSQDATVQIWQVPSLQPVAALSPPTPPLVTTGALVAYNGLAYTPNGQTLLTAGSDGTAQVWQLNPSRVVRDLCDALRGPQLVAQWQELASNAGSDPCPPG
jgi:WD40 repeat protein